MLIDNVEQLKEWLTSSLSPICEADPGALAKYVVALVKKEKPLSELKDSCVDQLEVFLQTKTKPFVETLFQVLDDKSYVKEEEPKPVTTPTEDENVIPLDPPLDEPVVAPTATTDHQLVTSTSSAKLDVKKDEEIKEDIPPAERRRCPSPRFRFREDERRRRYDDRRPFGRGFTRRRSTSPGQFRGSGRLRSRSRSPYRRMSPFRPIQRSRSPRPRGRGRGRSWSRSWSRSRSRTPPRRSWSRSRSRERIRSRSPGGSVLLRSPRREVRARSPRVRSPIRRSVSPRFRSHSRSPSKRTRSPVRSRSGSPKSKSPIGSKSESLASRSPKRSRSGSSIRKVRRQSPDSRGPTPNTNAREWSCRTYKPYDCHSSISVVTQVWIRYGDTPSVSRMRCRNFDEKGFCIRGDLCVYDHGVDPVVVENVPQYPPGELVQQPPFRYYNQIMLYSHLKYDKKHT